MNIYVSEKWEIENKIVIWIKRVLLNFVLSKIKTYDGDIPLLWKDE